MRMLINYAWARKIQYIISYNGKMYFKIVVNYREFAIRIRCVVKGFVLFVRRQDKKIKLITGSFPLCIVVYFIVNDDNNGICSSTYREIFENKGKHIFHHSKKSIRRNIITGESFNFVFVFIPVIKAHNFYTKYFHLLKKYVSKFHWEKWKKFDLHSW